MSDIIISMVIPCYNHGQYIQDCVRSLVGGETVLGLMEAQSVPNIEVIVVDDCSTDNSWEKIAKLVEDNVNVRAIKLPKNSGTAVAINSGMRIAKGDYLATMSADDMREQFALENLLKALQEDQHSFSYDDIVLIVNGRRQNKVWKSKDYDFDESLYKNMVHAGIMFTRQAFIDTGGYPEAFSHGREDWAMGVNLGSHGYCGIHVDYPGYLYRRHDNNRTIHNVDEESNKRFLQQMKDTYPSIYLGERPMGCCGGKSRQPQSNNPLPDEVITPGSKGFVTVEYLGGNYGIEPYYGPYTGVCYRFSASSPVKNIDIRDAHTDQGTGLLDLVENRRSIFRVYKGFSQEEPSSSSTSTNSVSVLSSPSNSPDLPEIVSPTPTVEMLYTGDLSEIVGIDSDDVTKLKTLGIDTVEKFSVTPPSQLYKILGWSMKRIETMQIVAKTIK